MSAVTDSGKPHRSLARFIHVVVLASVFAPHSFATQHMARSLVNKHAPEIARADLNGARVSLRSLRGKVVLLNFWAAWCAPCLIEMPVFSAWQHQYAAQGFQVIGISMDDDAAPARKLAAKLNATYPIAMGDAKLGNRYGGVMGLPLSFLIDRNGVIRARYQGETDLKIIEKEMINVLGRR